MRAIDILKAESNLSTYKKHVLKLPSGKDLEFYSTPITLAERKQAGIEAKSEEQLEINLQLVIAKARDVNGQPLFSPGDIGALRRAVTAEFVSEIVNALYATTSVDDSGDEIDFSPKPSSASSGKTGSSSSS
jgi:hypothetical protein